ncbi:MAG: DNA internalization-related competence protein ComEC/Rec2 [Fibrobacter sp.]|nr:DNA internalization-related competence protein ComEC/Rec2 [Fibrobacter sp.]
MKSCKTRKWTNFQQSLRELLQPLTGKPALLSALALMATYASLDFPNYALALLLPIALTIHFFPKSDQVAILFAILVGCGSHFLYGLDGDRLGNAGESLTAQSSSAPPTEACGTVESVLPRANGTAFIIRSTQARDGLSAKDSSFNDSRSFAAKTTPEAYRVRLTEKRDLPNLPEPGDKICYTASWYPVTPPTVPGAFNTAGWLQSQGLAAYGKLLHWDAHAGSWIPERSFYAFRKWIKSRFEDFLDPAETGLLLGLLAGDKSGIPEALRSDFQRSGLVHVLAISGFHVVLLAGMLMIFLKATRLPHRIVRIVAIILLFIYIPVTGGSPAVRRAVLMWTVPQIGALLQRPANTLNSLGVALLFILIPNPSELWNPGFQLSVAATAGILIGGSHNPLQKLEFGFKQTKIWKFLENFIFNPTYVTLCATLATAPFLIHHFKTLSPFAWLGNIVVVPAISMGMQAGLFALLSPLDFLREHFCYAAGFFLRLASLLTRFLSDSAEASLTVGPFGPAILLLLGSLFILFPVVRKNSIARTYSLICFALFAGIFCYESYTKILSPRWSLTAIDVGQGDSFLITTPSGKNFLIDAGDNSRTDSGKDIIIPFLHYSGIIALDALIITHPDADHFGGAESILKSFPVHELWISACARTEDKEDWQDVLSVAADRKIPIRDVGRSFLWSEMHFKLKALHPYDGPNATCGEVNTGSITLQAEGLGHKALLTGDLTTAGEKEILKTDIPLKSEILKLGHHGSKTSSSRKFLEAVRPRLAIISSGRKNRFRHPHKPVINRLDSLQIPYLNTATSGSIMMEFAHDTTVIKTMWN